MSTKNKMRGHPVLTKRHLRIDASKEVEPFPDEIPARGPNKGKTPGKGKGKKKGS